MRRSSVDVPAIDSAKALADDLMRQGRYAEAVEAYGRAIGLDVESDAPPAPRARAASLLHNRALALMKGGRLDDALADAEATVELAPTWRAAYTVKAQVLHRQGRTADATQCAMRGKEMAASAPRSSLAARPSRPPLLGLSTASGAATLRTPPSCSVDREARSFERGNRPLVHLGPDGRIFVRGVGYTLVPRREGGYIGGGAFGRVWKARRDAPPIAPLHIVRDGGGDGATRLLNLAHIAVKIFRCDGAAGEAAATAADARREIEMHSRAGHFVPGAMALLAVTPIAPDGGGGEEDEGGAHRTRGPVTVNARWTETKKHAASPEGARWVLMACELASHGTLRSWVNRLDLRGCGVWTRAFELAAEDPELAAQPGGAVAVAAAEETRMREGRTLIRGGASSSDSMASDAVAATETTELQERLACGLMLRLLRQVKRLHAHGVLHLDLKLDNIALDGKWGVRLIDFGLARPIGDPRLGTLSSGTPGFRDPQRGRSAASDVFSLGCVLHCLLAGARSVFQVAAWHAHFDSLLEPTLAKDGGGRGAGAQVQEFFEDLRTAMASDNPFRPGGVPSEHAAHLLAHMLRRDASKRLSVDQCLAHPWFTDMDDEAAFAGVVESVTDALGGEMQALANDASLSVRSALGVGSEGGEHDVGGGLLRVVFPPVARPSPSADS